jgi:bifunctional UDP-N-acetylglucosamine pyrophosphorylase/glucosamine-1-phosphate N-acetyltransferase
MTKNIAVVILAAGKSTRMKSETPKVLHRICGRPMLEYVLDLVRGLKAKKVVAVLGYKHEEVRKYLGPGVTAVVQKKLLGTADALKCALGSLKGFKGTVLVLYGDTPLLQKETVSKLLKYHVENNVDATLLTGQLEKPEGYGRILRDKYSGICGIVEEKDADDFDKAIKEINTGIVCFNKDKLVEALKHVKADNRKKEFYLTDTIRILYASGALVEAIKISDINEALGINNRSELAKANAIMQARINQKYMLDGVSIVDPGSTFISWGTKIGKDSVIYPFTVIEKDVNIGKYCSVGPFAHLREGTRLADDTLIGNFIEITRSSIGPKTIVKHFSYIGDTQVGKLANIGAGTVVANFDGKNKHRTKIADGAFIGSDTILVAPVAVGKGARTGAGSVIIRDVPDKTTVVGVPARVLKHK